ncbi:MAG: ComF family protein [Candidatus Marinimicrobia bacterium]|nr:ComF family protein [Candidatus Neomarinimicrobiota bacterium]
MNSILSYIQPFLLNLVYPNHCLACNDVFSGGDCGICDSCLNTLEPTELGNWIDQVTNPTDIDKAFSGWYFNLTLQKVIHSLKYQERAKLGCELGRVLGQLLPLSTVGTLDLLLPVPLYPAKKRDRGYNQAMWITKGLSETWDVPMKPHIIQRTKFTKSQTKLSVNERQKNMENAIKVRKKLSGKTIGIVDDVLTTGSTISSCAAQCKKQGASSVVAITCSTPKMTVETSC